MRALEDDLPDRRPVWAALSNLFLDTALQPTDFAYMARILASSPYSTQELEKILRREVYPVLSANLLSIAGEWGGFDPEWLEEKIVAHARSKLKWPFQCHFGAIRQDWLEVRRSIEALRGEDAPDA